MSQILLEAEVNALSLLKKSTQTFIESLKLTKNPSPQKQSSTMELMAGLIAISAPYMHSIKAYSDQVNTFISRIKASDNPDQDSVQKEIKALEQSKQDLINTFLEKVATDRLALLLHEDNLELARGGGANKTIYTSPTESAGNIDEILKSVQVLVTKRVFSTKQKDGTIHAIDDGIGPFGGLLEMLNKVFQDMYFDVDKYNSRDAEFIGTLKAYVARMESQLSKTPENYQLQCLVSGMRMLVELTDTQDSVKISNLQSQLSASYFDDITFNGNQLQVIKDINRVAENGSNREMMEEPAELAPAVQKALHFMIKNAVSNNTVLGGRYEDGSISHIIDLNFILRVFCITQDKAVASAVSPIMIATEVLPKLMEDLKKAKDAARDEKIANHVTKADIEVKNLVITDLAHLRRCSGKTESGEDLSVAVGKDRILYGDYANRYSHESFVAEILTMRILAKALKDTKNAKQAFQDKMIAIAEQDQYDVIHNDHRKHELSHLSKAKIMFTNSLVGLDGEEKDARAYAMLASEISRGSPQLNDFVDPGLLREMDIRYHKVHDEQVAGTDPEWFDSPFNF